ncbi:hypothetical protein ABT150_34270 [Streptomyces mirabilis]|uniref:hypothetical protein n=1 Tax=Streptomyces mirabilis TaxID=68239 RepID=UPI003325D6D8
MSNGVFGLGNRETSASSEHEVTVELDGAPWRELDGPTVAAAAAGLQLLPVNIPRLLRLQRLAAVGAALPPRPTAPRLSPSRLRSVLKQELISGPEVRPYEDLYDDLYTHEVSFHDGSYLTLPGLTPRSPQTVALLLRAVFGADGVGLPDAYRQDAFQLSLTVLRLSDALCRRAGLARGLIPPTGSGDEVSVPSQANLDRLCRVVSFDHAALTHLLPPDGRRWTETLSLQSGAHALEQRPGPEQQGLVVTPLLETKSGIVVCNPGELASALRHHLLVFAEQHGCLSQVAAAFHGLVVRSAQQALRAVGAEATRPAMTARDHLVTRQRFALPGGKFLDLAVATNDLTGFDACQPFGPSTPPPKSVASPLPDERNEPVTDPEKTMALQVRQHLGRSWLPPRLDGPPVAAELAVDLFDLRTMIELDGEEPMFLWRFACARTRWRDATSVITWSVLDEYAVYRENDFSFYLSDQRQDVVMLPVGAALDVRVRAQEKRDPHAVRSPHDDSFVPVLSRHGTGTAPLYLSLSGPGGSEDLVEWGDLHLWVGGHDGPPGPLADLSRNVREAAAYWLWQICLSRPELVLTAAGDDKILYAAVRFDDEPRWNAVLSGIAPSAATHAWLDGSYEGGTRLELQLQTAGAATLLDSIDNTADRELVLALLTALHQAADWNLASVPVVLEQVAPPGNKRKLHVTWDHDIKLRASGLPAARMVQPAVSADVLDELGAWLPAQGLPVGPVPAEERTEVLKKAVGHYFTVLVDTVARLSPQGLLEELVVRDEALLYRDWFRDRILPAYLACFGPDSLPVQQLARENREHVRASIASRFLVEYIAATPPTGTEPLTLDVYDHLLALTAELTDRAMLSDAIFYGFSDTQIGLLDSGRLGVLQGDRYQAGVRALTDAQAATFHRIALETAPVAPAPEGPTNEVESAMAAEFGFTLGQLVYGLAELILLGDEQPGPLAMILEADAVDRLCTIPGWSTHMACGFIDHLSLSPRPQFMSIGVDACPWRFNRDQSYARRPLIKVPSPAGPALMWGPRRVYDTARYWGALIYSGRMRGQTKAMKRLMGTIRQAENKQFEQTAADTLRLAGCSIVASSISKFNGRRLSSPEGSDLGDIDALGIDPKSRSVFLIEAKDFELARTPAELAGEADSLLRGEKSAVHKHSRRAEWVRDNLTSVLQHFRVADHSGRWMVLPVITISRDLISPRILDPGLPIVPMPDLKNWVTQQIQAGSSGRRRKRR